MWNLLIALIWFGQITASAGPQAAATAPAGSELRVFIVTMGPGDEPYEKFGHNMLRITDPSLPADDPWHDIAYNWGIFEFDKGFIVNFIQGRLRYWMAPLKAQPSIQAYIDMQDRTVWQQELNLSPAQKRLLRDFCEYNSQDENKYYMYDYFLDNCSTRVRDALDRATGGQLKRQAQGIASDLTFRSETQRLTCSDWWLYVALDYVLGHPTDRKLTAWDEMFIPMRMRERLNQLKIKDESGNELPLVKSEERVHNSARPPQRDKPPFWVPWFFLVGLAMGGGIAACAIAMLRIDGRWKRVSLVSGFLALAMFWSVLSAFGGSFLAHTWLFTDHSAVRPNENILQLGPWMLPMVALLPLALRKRWNRSRKTALAIAAFAAAMSVLGLLLKVVPMMNQSNWNIIALALPANAGLALGLWTLTRTAQLNQEKEATE